ncbi:MAG: hypothetical protein A2359_03250 [Candidatus Moranbacteria bacterium RIFOXYB1_FULL_43_19]|nr:MAG: hypothetical protein A2359_03250 [Candidatus Moranbacteria bacterium RIFOXYB1_FULL_43_19]OGI28395.1 MAG: hypothetical protein A2184_01755 [Candidatus Moranbacteria bacterium RIFOXYA1_FULL_44_7]OGI32571.1 MAG: hypothetical protein A2420_03285 [Candidatus Moranbacteria bacterium RIFOXYC1_FULL_44_13]
MKKKKINKVTLEAIAGLIKKGSEDTKEYVRNHVSSEIEKLAIIVVDRFDQVDKRFDGVEGRLDGVEGRLGKVENGIGKLKERMAAVEYGQYEIHKKLDNVAYKYDLAKLESKFERRFQKIEAKISVKSKAK